MRGKILTHALVACLKRMIRPESAGQQSKPILEMRDRPTGHGRHGIIDGTTVKERTVVRQQGPPNCQFSGATEFPLGSLNERVQPTREIMLRTPTTVPKKQLSRPRAGRTSPNLMMSAAEAEEALASDWPKQRHGEPIGMHPAILSWAKYDGYWV
ncbi:hypothetical protein NBRC116584_29900 [Hydrogenophaga sp. 5NK40-0174]